MITIIARWEDQQMSPDLEWRMWRQLKGAFTVEPVDMRLIFVPILLPSNIAIEQYNTMEEALSAAGDAPRVFLEPKGNKTLSEMPDGDIVIVLGNTNHSNAQYAKDSEMYRINALSATDLYGINAAAIALAYKVGQ